MASSEFLWSFSVCGIYQVTHKLHRGSIADVMRAFNILTGCEVAIKMELRNNSSKYISVLQLEAAMYKMIPIGTEGFPRIHYAGPDANHYVLVMDKLGPNLDALRQFCRGQFSLRTICMLAEQMLDRLEFLHSRGIVSCDIKPHNFAMGSDANADIVYLFDFEHSRLYIDPSTGLHVPFRTERHSTGTVRYASVAAHRRHQVSRRDDIESLLYVFLELHHGKLPWSYIRLDPEAGSNWLEPIVDMKAGPVLRDLLARSPSELADYYAHCSALTFGQRPDYELLRGLFRGRMKAEGWMYDWKFDWVDGAFTEKGTLIPSEYNADMRFVVEKEWNPITM
ncbi:kinase-like protein [Pilatotrama ljubarskyi]|nr:kinase-like protein [Pilatotrama ljubarskyi]